jgi:glycosyltransferase involved in cell wall biosynthesis
MTGYDDCLQDGPTVRAYRGRVSANGSELDTTTEFQGRAPIRILFVIDSLWVEGGGELSLVRLLRHLPSDRFECRVLTFHSGPTARPLWDRFPCPIYHWQLNNLYGANALRVALRIRKLVQEQHIEIVHTFFGTSDLWAGPIAKMSGAKVLISSRRDMGILRKRKHTIGYRILRDVYDQVQTVSESVRQFTIQVDGTKPERTLTIYNGTDPLEATPQEVRDLRCALQLQPGTPVVVCVANCRYVKGIDVLVRVASLVGKQIPDARFFVVGHFSHPKFAEKMQALNCSLGGEERLRFFGPSKQVAAFLEMCDLFVLPSRSEGLSNALLEAMEIGRACVATAVGGNPELVLDGVNGFLTPPEDPDAMANRITKLLRDPLLRSQMGAAGRERVRQKFTTEAMVARVIDSYERLLEAKRTPRREK